MKTKILLIIPFLFAFLIPELSHSAWYGGGTYGIWDGNCPTDAEPDAVWPAAAPPYAGGAPYYVVQAQVVGGGAGALQCQFWDATAPSVSATNASAVWKNVDIPLIGNASDYGGSGLNFAKWSINNANCWGGTAYADGYATTISVEGDYTLYLCGQDGVGIQGTWNGQYRLDKTSPVLSANNTSALWKNADINITLSASDALSGLNGGTVKYSWDGVDCVTGGNGFVNNQVITLSTEGQHTLNLCASDNAGNTQTWSSNQYKLDKTNPTLSANNASALWKNADINITLSASDAGGSALNPATVKYRWDNNDCVGGGNVFADSNVITLSTEGDHILYLCAADNAGNTQTWNGVYRLDKTKPVLSANNTSALWKNADINITLSASDAGGSALNAATVKYRWDNSDCVGGGTVFANNTVITLSAEGQHRLYLCAADNAGNTFTWDSDQYKLDKTLPVVWANNNSAVWRNANIVISLSASDAGGSALSNTRYVWHLNNIGGAPSVATCLAAGTPFNNGDTITLSTEGDHTLYLCAEDNATNQGSWNGVYRLDKTIPIVSATNASVIWQAGPIPVTFHESDPIPYAGAVVSHTNTKKYYWDYLNTLGGGVVNFAYCMANGTNFVDGNNMVMNTPGDHTLYMCANDVATNNSALWSGIYRFDDTPPFANNLTYANAATNGWTNNTTITANWVAGDVMPGSGIKNHDVRIYESVGNAQDPIVWNPIPIVSDTTPGAASTYTYVGTNGKAYKFEVLPRDNANNVPALWTTSPDVARIDTTLPDQNNLIMTTATSLLATGSQDFKYTFNDGGAPVALVGQMEDPNNPAGWVASFAGLPFSYTQSFTHDVSVVDAGGDRTADGNTARNYTHKITQICDQAGNCWNGLKTYSYNVYANPNYNFTIVGNNTAFTLGSVVADGSIKTWQAQIHDGFGNAIIPAAGIARVVNYDLSNITNAMYLNQYARSGPTSVYVIPPSGAEVGLTNAATQNLGNQASANGSYPLGVRVYTPTSNGHLAPDQISDPNATFAFDINLTVSDALIGASKSVSHGSPAFRYEPLFRTVFNGELNDGGFIEGTEQTSTIDVIENPLASPGGIGSEKVELTFSGTEATKFDFYADSTSPVSTLITNKTQFNVSPGFSAGTIMATPFKSQLVQKPSIIVTNLSNLWLTSHLSYTLDGKTINTNSDSIGKDSFFGAATPDLGSQVGVKIIGAVSSKYINNMISGQFQSGTILTNYQNRSEVRNNVKKNIALAIRNASGSVVGTSITKLNGLPAGAGATGTILDQGPNGTILYIEKQGGDITLSTGAITGIKTIVVRGANLWIMRDMYYTNDQSILGVVVQKDENGNGGNLYISPNVTNVVGAYILDGSIISYNGTELGYNALASVLRNQLLIYGSIVSENSIGGSRATPPICPSMISLGACTLQTAQTYDLNYLRRYYLVGNNPSAGSMVIGRGTCVAGVCGGFDPKLRKLFSNTTSELARYPIVIEYNPLIQRTPPIGFGNVLGN